MKYSEASYPVNKKFIADMNDKMQSFKLKTKTRFALHPTLITTYPVAENEYASELQAIVTAEDLFAQ